MKRRSPRGLIFFASFVFLTTTLVWIYGVSNHRFLMSEFWLYVGIYLIPALLVCGCVWLIFRKQTWQRATGVVLLLPALGIWVISLVLVFAGFKIH